jgi:hypothetical protein
MDQGTEYRDSYFLSKAGLLEPDKNCCNKSQSISIEILREDFARKTVPCFLSIGKKLPSPTPHSGP